MARRSGLVFLSTLAGRVLNFVSQIVLSNLLGLRAFGTFTYCHTVLSFLSAICLAGFSHTTVRYIANARARNQPAEIRTVIRLALVAMSILTSIAATGLFLFRHQIAAHWLGKPELAPFLVYVAIGLPAMVLMVWIGFPLRGFREVTAEAIVRNLIKPAVLIAIVVVIALLVELTLPLAIWALLASIAAAAGFGAFRLQRCLPRRTADQTAAGRRREMTKYALHIWVSRFSGIVLNQADRLMLGALSTLSQVGIYHAAYRLADFQVMAVGSFLPVFSTVIAEAHARGDRQAIVAHYRTVVRWSLLVTIPVCLACWLFAKPILSIYGPDFVDGATVLMIISVSSLVDAGVGPAGQFLQMMGRPRIEMACLALGAGLAVGLNIFLIPKYGAAGAALGSGSAVVAINLGRLLSLKRILGVFPYTRLTLISLAVAAAVGLMTWAASGLNLLVQIVLFVATYVFATLKFAVHPDDRRMFRHWIEKLKSRGDRSAAE